MISIAVAEGGRKTISEQLRGYLDKSGIAVSSADTCKTADILVASADAPLPGLKAGVLIASGDRAGSLARQCGANMVVTYGLDPRDTITPSSLLHEGGMATLQRELVGLSGNIVEPQEIDLTGYQGSLMDKMALSAALLLTVS